MQLDSKESDIEQLREKLNDLQQRMDNSSVTSLQTDETDSNIAGRVTTAANSCAVSPHTWENSKERYDYFYQYANSVSCVYMSIHWSCSMGYYLRQCEEKL